MSQYSWLVDIKYWNIYNIYVLHIHHLHALSIQEKNMHLFPYFVEFALLLFGWCNDEAHLLSDLELDTADASSMQS